MLLYPSCYRPLPYCTCKPHATHIHPTRPLLPPGTGKRA
jgi:hypothetical protein